MARRHGHLAWNLDGSDGDARRSPKVVPTVAPPTIGSIPFSQIPVVLRPRWFLGRPVPSRTRFARFSMNSVCCRRRMAVCGTGAGPYGPVRGSPGRLTCTRRIRASRAALNAVALRPGLQYLRREGSLSVHRSRDRRHLGVHEFSGLQLERGLPAARRSLRLGAAVHGETGTGAIIMPWHMAANIECTCNNLAATASPGSPDSRRTTARSTLPTPATLVAKGGGKGLGTGACHTDFPNALTASRVSRSRHGPRDVGPAARNRKLPRLRRRQ
jgi:hypothetical protein